MNTYWTLMTVAKAWVYSPGARAQAVSLLEALSCGAVLALARENFVSPFLRDGENVLLLEEQSAGNFALALNERLNNTALLHKIRQEARETVLRNFAQERVLPMQTRFLETCTGHERRRGHRVLAQSCKWRRARQKHILQPSRRRGQQHLYFRPRNASARFGGFYILGEDNCHNRPLNRPYSWPCISQCRDILIEFTV